MILGLGTKTGDDAMFMRDSQNGAARFDQRVQHVVAVAGPGDGLALDRDRDAPRRS